MATYTIYKTTDGREFSSEREARQHQDYVDGLTPYDYGDGASKNIYLYNQVIKLFNNQNWKEVIETFDKYKSNLTFNSRQTPHAVRMRDIAFAILNDDYDLAFTAGKLGEQYKGDEQENGIIICRVAIDFGKKIWEKKHGRTLSDAEFSKMKENKVNDNLQEKINYWESKIFDYLNNPSAIQTTWDGWEKPKKECIMKAIEVWEEKTGREFTRQDQIRIAGKEFMKTSLFGGVKILNGPYNKPSTPKFVPLKTDEIEAPPLTKEKIDDFFSAANEFMRADNFVGRKKVEYSWGVYEGDFSNNLANGKGKMTYKSGDVYEGDWVDGNEHGKGKYTWGDDGAVFEGYFLNGDKNGKGRMVFADGRVYEGDYVDDKRTGKGKMTYPDGDIYEGDFDDNKLVKGKITSKNGYIYEGNFDVLSSLDGKGKITIPNGLVQDGYFSNGVFLGSSPRPAPQADEAPTNFTGNGRFAYLHSVYEGSWVDGRPNGNGKMTWEDGKVYEGGFQYNNPSGVGKMTYPNGDVYEGNFRNGNKSGNGKMTYADGKVEEGKWRYDKFEG